MHEGQWNINDLFQNFIIAFGRGHRNTKIYLLPPPLPPKEFNLGLIKYLGSKIYLNRRIFFYLARCYVEKKIHIHQKLPFFMETFMKNFYLTLTNDRVS